MDAPMQKGTKVKQKVVVIEGEVLDIRFDADALGFEYLVQWNDPAEADGKSERWFASSQIEAKAPAKAEEKKS